MTVKTTLLALFMTFFPPALPAAMAMDGTDLTIRNHPFRVELAMTDEEHERGLMFREELAADKGMLFVFPEEAPKAFWMKNTLIPLDILFIKGDGTILTIHENAVPKDLRPLGSGGKVSRALELKGGTVQNYGIRPGDVVYNKQFFGNEPPGKSQ